MFADGDSEALLDEAAEVDLELVVRDAGHGDTLGTFGEGEAKGLADGDGVIVEGFVEVADAEEENAVRVPLFEAGELAHGGGVTGVGQGEGLRGR